MCDIDIEVLSSQVNLERNQDLSDFCQSVLSIDKGLIFTGIINNNGRVLESCFRDDRIIKKLDPKEIEMLFMQYSLRTSMMQDFDAKLSPSKYTLVERNTIAEFSFPSHFGIIFVISNPNIYPRNLARKISKIVNEFNLWTEAKNL